MITINQYSRPIVLAILLSVVGEVYLLIYYGIIQYPQGSFLYKFLWTVVFCGLGMGTTLGAMTVLFIVDRFSGIKAIMATTFLSLILLGLVCNLLCLNLDRHFQFFGGHEDPVNFFISGINYFSKKCKFLHKFSLIITAKKIV